MPKGEKVSFGTKVKVYVEKEVRLDDPFLQIVSTNKDYEGIMNFLMEQIKKAKG